MSEWVRFGIIICVAAAEYAAEETIRSFNTTWDFLRYRVRWIVRDKLRAMWSGARR